MLVIKFEFLFDLNFLDHLLRATFTTNEIIQDDRCIKIYSIITLQKLILNSLRLGFLNGLHRLKILERERVLAFHLFDIFCNLR